MASTMAPSTVSSGPLVSSHAQGLPSIWTRTPGRLGYAAAPGAGRGGSAAPAGRALAEAAYGLPADRQTVWLVQLPCQIAVVEADAVRRQRRSSRLPLDREPPGEGPTAVTVRQACGSLAFNVAAEAPRLPQGRQSA